MEMYFKRKNARKLILCLLLLQPLTAKELKYFFPLMYYIFASKKKEFPPIDKVIREVERIFEREINQFSIFLDKDLYSKDGVLKQLVKSGAIIEVPSQERKKQGMYYFLNSDLVFEIKPIAEKPLSVHNLNNNFILDNTNGEKISLMSNCDRYSTGNHFDIVSFLSSLPYIADKNHQSKLKQIWGKELPYNPFKGKLHRKVIEIGLIWWDGVNKKYILNPCFSHTKLAFRFSPSYKILECFEKDINYKKSPIQNLREFIKENYEINPRKRAMSFTSFEKVDEIKKEEMKKTFRRTGIERNVATDVYLSNQVFNNVVLLNSISDFPKIMYPKLFDYKQKLSDRDTELAYIIMNRMFDKILSSLNLVYYRIVSKKTRMKLK